jgi:hypothetical protein
MRTTLDIEDDVLQAAKDLAQRQGVKTGKIISERARRGLADNSINKHKPFILRNGVPLLPSRGELITLEHISSLME